MRTPILVLGAISTCILAAEQASASVRGGSFGVGSGRLHSAHYVMGLNLGRPVPGGSENGTYAIRGNFPFPSDVVTAVDEPPRAGVLRAFLHPPRPNPFNPSTTIVFDAAAGSRVTVKIFDVAGRLVRTVFEGPAMQRRTSVVWRGLDRNGSQVGSGVYLVQMASEDMVMTRRATLTK